MKRLFLTAFFLAALFCHQASGQTAKHVVLITIDGFRPDFYLDPTWGAVNLRQLMAKGACVKGVNGIFPTVTYPSHTTLVTGVKPVVHGIYYNAPFEPNGPSKDWYWHFSAMKAPTLWEAARKAGMTTASVLWPVSAGAPIDYNIPDIWNAGERDRREVTGRYATPPGLWKEVEQHATGEMEANDFNLDKDYLSMDDNVARIAGYLIRKYKPAFTTVHLPAVDHAEHDEGRDGDAVRRAVSGADRSVRTIMEAIDKAGISETTAVIITGDHGFVNRSTNFNPNVLLAKAGLITDINSGNWKARFYSAGGSAFLHLKDKGDQKSLAEVKKILGALPAEKKKLFTLIEGTQLKNSGADPNATLALTATPGSAIGNALKGDVVEPSHGGTHGHFPDFAEIQTGLIATGPGFKAGTVIPVMEMVDIAPIVAKLLGIDFSGIDGKGDYRLLSK